MNYLHRLISFALKHYYPICIQFLTNQTVIDICSNSANPLEACRHVVSRSYKKWMEKEGRTDDITMICIFVDDVSSSN